METWYNEHCILFYCLFGLTSLVLGSYAFTWACFLLNRKRIEALFENHVNHIKTRLQQVEKALGIRDEGG